MAGMRSTDSGASIDTEVAAMLRKRCGETGRPFGPTERFTTMFRKVCSLQDEPSRETHSLSAAGACQRPRDRRSTLRYRLMYRLTAQR